MLNMLWTGEYSAEWEENFSKVVNVKRAGFNITNNHADHMNEDQVIEALQGCEIYFCGYDAVTKKVLDNCPDLKLILSVRDGPEENIDLQACKEAGVPVLNSAGRCTVSVAELTFNLIMNMARPVIDVTTRIRNEKWTADNRASLRSQMEKGSFELCRKTLGIIGLGRNGQYLAKLGQAFNMKVVAYDPFLPEDVATKMNVELMSLNDVCRVSDYISVLARVTAENKGLVGKEQFDLMKPECGFVNTGRAALVDTTALKEALVNGKIRKAAIDVHDKEPLGTEDSIYDIPAEKLIITNHMAGFVNERAWHQYDIGFDNMQKFLKGEMLQNNCTRGVEGTEAYKNRGAKLFGSAK